MLGALNIEGFPMTSLTKILEKLDSAITGLEKAVDGRITRLEAQQRDLFAQVDAQKDQTQHVARELDGIISHLEKALQPSNSAVQ